MREKRNALHIAINQCASSFHDNGGYTWKIRKAKYYLKKLWLD